MKAFTFGPLTNLEELFVPDCKLCSEGFSNIAKLQSLQTLNISGNNLFAIDLVHLQHLPCLKRLTCSTTESVATVDWVSALTKLTSLTYSKLLFNA